MFETPRREGGTEIVVEEKLGRLVRPDAPKDARPGPVVCDQGALSRSQIDGPELTKHFRWVLMRHLTKARL